MAKNKTIAAIAILLTLSFAISLVTLPNTYAQAATKKATYAFIGASPNPVGVGQMVRIHTGIPDALQTAADGWNLTVTIKKPNNQTETFSAKTDATGGTGLIYVPAEVGTYYLQTHFPEQWYNYSGFDFLGNPVSSSMLYEASDSPLLALNVTEEAVSYYPGVPLPTEYWTRPIDAQMREWSAISGDWLVATPILPTDNLYAPNNDGPESAHVLWAMPIGDTMGGLAGGADQTGYGIGDAYEGKMLSACIISGVYFYNKYDSISPEQAVVAVDLHTGEVLWTRTLLNNLRLSFGQVLHFKSMNYQGDFSYLWATSGTSWYAFEPLTGDWKYNMTNVPSGTNYYGPNGEILRYTVNQRAGWMTQWNTTSVVVKSNTGMGVAWGSQTQKKQFDASAKGYDWNVTIPTDLPGSVRTVTPLDRVIGAEITTTSVTIWALNLKLGHEGDLLYKKTWQAPSDWAAGNQTISWAAASLTDNVAVLYSKELTNYYAFSLSTGQYIWGPTESENYLNMYDRISTINYGILVSSGCSGTINGYNATTGDLMWTYVAKDPYGESLTGTDAWWMQQMFITDGKVYLGHVEHSPNQPLPRGAPFICLDIYTGTEVWKMSGGFRQTCWGGKAMIGDSIIAMQNTYDQRVYAVGKGPSCISVEAPMTGVTLGSSVVIRGAVIDVSPGTTSDALTLRFPNGVPAVSDACMSDWMKYVYMQFPEPSNATGVDVTLSVIDANNNCREIGTATSDANGFFSYEWNPDIPGKFTVIATFAGSKSYWPSQAETAFAVDPAPEATPGPTPTPASMSEMYFLPSVAGIIVAIAVVGALILLLLRKRP
jgi:hypothetical protein